MSRQVRVETRSRHQNDLKRVMHSTEKVRKWEKKWVRIEETSLQIFKWMPITKNEEQQRQQMQQQISTPMHVPTAKRPHEASPGGEANELAHSQNSKRVKTSEEILSVPTGISTSFVESGPTAATTLHAVRSAVASPVPTRETYQQPPAVHHPAVQSANLASTPMMMHETSHTQSPTRAPLTPHHQHQQAQPQAHLQHPQQHVQPSTTTTTYTTMPGHIDRANDEVVVKPSIMNGTPASDVDMMDTEDIVGQPQERPQEQPPQAVSEMTDSLMEDFSSIVRNVTEQIVIKVSDCYGGDS